MFLVIGFLAVMAGLIVSINNSKLSYDYFTQTTEALRNAAESNSVLTQAMGNIETNKLVSQSLYATGIGSLLFGIGLALVDLLRINSWMMKK
jgi:hypothetical protein